MIRNISRICTLAILLSSITPTSTIKAAKTSTLQVYMGIPTALVGIIAWRMALKKDQEGQQDTSGNDSFFSASLLTKSISGKYKIFGTLLIVSGLAHVFLGLKN